MSQIASEFYNDEIQLELSIQTQLETYLLPFEAYLQIMVHLNEAEEVFQNGVRFVFRHAKDALCKVRIDEDGLPACHRVRPIKNKMSFLRYFERRTCTLTTSDIPNDRVHSLEMTANVSR